MLHPRSSFASGLVLGASWALLLVAPAAAQQDESADRVPLQAGSSRPDPLPTAEDGAAGSLQTERSAVTARTLVAIHTAPDDPEGGAYGTWAAAETYKASFHDGFRFVPYLGGGYPRNQSFGWRTVEVTVGGEVVQGAERAATWHDDYRYEYRFSAVTEAYDLRPEGVEQTFVVARRPSRPGDLVVSGEVSTDLVAPSLVDRHAALTFRDDEGHALIHYGAATAVDARGKRLALRTSWDGSRIHLRVPSSWLAEAAFPVTIDPLLTRECTSFWTSVNPPPTSGKVLDTEVGRDDLANQIMVAYTRQASAADSDLWVFLFDSDTPTFAGRNQVFIDLSDLWGNLSPAIGFAGGTADSWIVAFIREGVGGGGTENGVRYHRRASGDVTPSSGVSFVSRPAGSSHGNVVDVGGVMGNSAGESVFLVYERTDAGSNSDVFGKPVNLATNGQGAEILLDTSAVGTDRTRLRPSINQVAQSGTDGWVVAWQEYWNARNSGANDDWDINMRRITGAGDSIGLVRAPRNSTDDGLHKMTPRISGANSRYQMTMAVWEQGTQTPTTTDVGTDIFNEPFTWTTADTFTFGAPTIELTNGLVSDRRWRVTDGTHDTNSDSHWVWTFESILSGSQYACSTGFDGGRIERLVAYNPTSTPDAFGGSVTFNDDDNEFVLSYATDEGGAPCGSSRSTNHTVYVQRMTHLPEPPPSRYGLGCGRGVISWSGRNLVGIRSYSVHLANATPSVPAVLFLAPNSGSLPLDLFGMPGCMLNVDLFSKVDIPSGTTLGGRATFRTGIPTNPGIICGDLHWQWAYLAPGLNNNDVGATRGLLTPFVCP